MTGKPFSAACERNRGPLLDVLREALAGCRSVLEIGSGSGQHAVYFAAHMPQLTWQTSELPANHAGIRAWLDEAQLPNLRSPLALDLAGPWPAAPFDAVFTANTLHIVAWPLVENFFAGAATVLPPGGVLAVYGPFNYGGAYSADSNAQFDLWVKANFPGGGIRDFERVCELAAAHRLEFVRDVAMPANNRTLLWRRLSAGAP
jgi:cyclopropane fatty-acyl-phospholipid synthase-like methyltransferase